MNVQPDVRIDVRHTRRRGNDVRERETEKRTRQRARRTLEIGSSWFELEQWFVPDARTLRRCRWRTRLMTRKFKNWNPVGRPTPISFLCRPSSQRDVRPSSRRTMPTILIDRSRFVSVKLILNAPKSLTMLRAGYSFRFDCAQRVSFEKELPTHRSVRKI